MESLSSTKKSAMEIDEDEFITQGIEWINSKPWGPPVGGQG